MHDLQINKTSWFPTEVYDCDIEHHYCDQILKIVSEDKDRWNKNLKNVQALTSGWEGLRYPVLTEISDFITNKILPIIGQHNNWHYNNWKTVSAWINFYTPGDKALPHNHANDHYSAILIVKPSTGNLIFEDPKQIHTLYPPFEKHLGQRINENKGKLILFPSYLYHYVSECDDERVSVAFNFSNEP
jgi:hypothetical protein